MNKILSFVKLDFITIKPYSSPAALLVVFIAIVLMFPLNSTAAGMVMILASIYATHPFLLGEKNSLDQLYSTLPISKRDIIIGRYVFVLALHIMGVIISYIFLFTQQTIIRQSANLQEILITTLTLFFIFTFFQTIQIPIYFRLGYTKAKFIVYIPIIIFTILLVLTAYFSIETLENIFLWILTNQIITAILGAIILIVAMFASYNISLHFYKKRAF